MRYCSPRCRRLRVTGTDRALEKAILALAAERGLSSSFCPSEAARRVRAGGWRTLMERTRWAAFRLAAAGKIDVLQRGAKIEPGAARGPIRLRRALS